MSEVRTKVTDTAKVEEQVGRKLEPTDYEKRLQLAIQGHPIFLNKLETTIKKMSAKKLSKLLIATLDLAKSDLKIPWLDKTGKVKSGYEQMHTAYSLCQGILREKFIIEGSLAALKAQKAKESEESSEEINENVNDKEQNNG